MVANRYSNQKKSKSGLTYLVLTAIFVLVMFKWGVPFFMNILIGPSDSKSGSQVQELDTIPPQMPMLSALPEATNSASVSIAGYTEAQVRIAIWRNEELAETSTSDTTGRFSIETRLNDGENRILVKAQDKSGNESQSVTKIIVLDKIGAELTIDMPAEGTEIFGKSNQNIPVSGKVGEQNVTVSVNGNYARIGSDGRYSQTVRLSEGNNQIVVKAIDKAGNLTEKTVKVKLIL